MNLENKSYNLIDSKDIHQRKSSLQSSNTESIPIVL